ncbi:squalene--hopene cyclase [Azospirillum sp. TSO22-1]|uniref:squalene--hopene cyclase n=1 Tax=Azospirillum sp. TSO22-1 TaxID=716789 RepID=UPI000D611342|nr:squalene--hopene cyclase [Azospirillum sp. TSO22-1]PWC52640.1 squalene--hopene cyclase [Azospirillum sp. TSO22-1]
MDGQPFFPRTPALETRSSPLDRLVGRTAAAVKALQRDDGHWVFELEADTTIPAEYVLTCHFLGTPPDTGLEARIGRYLRARQRRDGGWPLFHEGDANISASVKAYFALKMIGDDPQAEHMRRARAAILAAGGAARSNVFTRVLLALYGEVPWRAVPVMPVELMLAPRWFPVHLSKIAYWSRVVLVPLLILQALKPRARNTRNVHIGELFVTPPDRERRYNVNPTGSPLGTAFLLLDQALRAAEPLIPQALRRRALRTAEAFLLERLNGEDGLGAIFPAMVNAVLALDALGYPQDHPHAVAARRAIDRLLVGHGDRAYCQPCASPVWDTALTAHALLEAGEPPDGPALRPALDWLRDRQILDRAGDWAEGRSNGAPRPGGWAFQYRNDLYPDVDDTAVVAMALHRADPRRYADAVARAAEWVLGMQSRNGGWGAYDADNTRYYLNHIPFADHGALLDPPTADVTARCLGFLAQIGLERDHPAVAGAVGFLLREQEADGSWYGRWGTNYVYGTWSVLCALNAVGEDAESPAVRRAVGFLESRQRPDGGWGEDCATYWHDRKAEVKASTPSQTAWAVLGLMAAGAVDSDAVRRGIDHLERAPRAGARWAEDLYTGVGFPRVFYLRYHGYAAYFPLWALARYRTLQRRNSRRVGHGL